RDRDLRPRIPMGRRERWDRGPLRCPALPWPDFVGCPIEAGAGPTILYAERRFMVRRFLATARFIGFRFAFALVFTAALAISMPSLFSLSRSNQFELENTEQIQVTC